MSDSRPTEQELLKAVLGPLLEDFQYWLTRSGSFLESERISFLKEEEQGKLLERVRQTQKEVNTAQILFKITEGQAGIDMAVLVPWHKLVAECGQVAMRWRSLKSEPAQESDY